MPSPTPPQLHDLLTSVQAFPALWESCKSSPADFNQLYTLVGEMLKAITLISYHLSAVADDTN